MSIGAIQKILVYFLTSIFFLTSNKRYTGLFLPQGDARSAGVLQLPVWVPVPAIGALHDVPGLPGLRPGRGRLFQGRPDPAKGEQWAKRPNN